MSPPRPELARLVLELGVRHRVAALSWVSVERLERHLPEANLGAYLQGARAVVVFGLPMLDGVVDTLLAGEPYFIRRWWKNLRWETVRPVLVNPELLLKQAVKGRVTFYNNRYHFEEHLSVLNAEINSTAYAIGRLLEDSGFRALPIDPCKRHYFPLQGFLSLNGAAVVAGMGRIGRHHQLIVPGAGTRVWLGGVLTDAPLENGPTAELELPCDACSLCVRACPVARREGGTLAFSPFQCKACSRCMAVCPAGRESLTPREPPPGDASLP